MKITLYPSAYDSAKSVVLSAADTENPIGKGVDNETYATFGVKTGRNAVTNIYYGFDASQIPQDAVIQSLSLSVKASISYNNGITRSLKIYSADTEKYSNSVAISTAPQIFNISSSSSGSWVRSELESVYLCIELVRGYFGASNASNLQIYGAELTIEYTSESIGKLFFKDSDTWVQCSDVYKKINGVWTLQNEYAPLFVAGKYYNKKTLEPPQDIYTTLEYIESDGNQYVDTGFIPNQNSAMVVKFATTSQAGAIAACDETWGAKGFSVYGQSLAFANDTSGGAHNFYDGNNHIVEMNKNNDGKVYDNGNLKWTATRATFTVPCSLTLFCVNRNSDKQEFIPAKIFYCKLYDNGVVVKHLVPCLRKADGVNGFFDLYNNEFLPLQII